MKLEIDPLSESLIVFQEIEVRDHRTGAMRKVETRIRVNVKKIAHELGRKAYDSRVNRSELRNGSVIVTIL